MIPLIDKINNTLLQNGELALFYLGQAGFAIKAASGKLIIIDAYLSDAAERMFGFKRMIPPVIEASACNADFWLSTHSHIDHLDLDILPVIARNSKTTFVGAPDCKVHYDESGIAPERCVILEKGEAWNTGELLITAVYADHGELAPEAVGFLIEISGIKIYHAGDTCYCPAEILPCLPLDIDVMLAPINGQFGNMNAIEACRLAALVKPRIVIATHFWMFLEHVAEGGLGDPATFLIEAKKLPHEIHARVMAPGEMLMIKK
ncbi:MAG: MBL fold metallo-hydrolase [Chitinophagaceae bacterium]|nr:MBL fold metallo-hydrolase [Chitinophagaceae bacterium]